MDEVLSCPEEIYVTAFTWACRDDLVEAQSQLEEAESVDILVYNMQAKH